MKTDELVLSSGEVAALLRERLGPLRSWDDALADMRRYKTSIYGSILLPVGRIRDTRAWRPAYRAIDVIEFIKSVRAANTDAKSGIGPKAYSVEIDLDDGLFWKIRKLSPASKGTTVH